MVWNELYNGHKEHSIWQRIKLTGAGYSMRGFFYNLVFISTLRNSTHSFFESEKNAARSVCVFPHLTDIRRSPFSERNMRGGVTTNGDRWDSSDSEASPSLDKLPTLPGRFRMLSVVSYFFKR